MIRHAGRPAEAKAMADSGGHASATPTWRPRATSSATRACARAGHQGRGRRHAVRRHVRSTAPPTLPPTRGYHTEFRSRAARAHAARPDDAGGPRPGPAWSIGLVTNNDDPETRAACASSSPRSTTPRGLVGPRGRPQRRRPARRADAAAARRRGLVGFEHGDPRARSSSARCGTAAKPAGEDGSLSRPARRRDAHATRDHDQGQKGVLRWSPRRARSPSRGGEPDRRPVGHHSRRRRR